MHAPKADGSRQTEFFTTYSRRILSAGEIVVAAMAVLPMKTDEDAEQQADGIRFGNAGRNGVQVALPAPFDGCSVRIDSATGAVTIHRPSSRIPPATERPEGSKPLNP